MPGSFLYEDTCHQSCPQHFYGDERQCVPCHEDCLECSGPSADDCDLCADSSLVLYDGQCLNECPAGTYYEKETKDCKGKDSRYTAECRIPGSLMGLWVSAETKQGLHSSSSRAAVPPLSLIFSICSNLLFFFK